MSAKNTLQFRINALANDAAEIFIYGDIGDSWFGESVTAQDIVRQLAEINAQTLYVRVNSMGGSVPDALAIHNALRRHSAKKIVTVDGWALSAASLIAMAGDTVEMAENALMMIHAPSTVAGGNANALRQVADLLDKFAQAMSASYVRKTGNSEDDVLALLTDGVDHWYTAAEAVEAGFADQITAAVALDVAAHPTLARFLAGAPAKIAASLRPLPTGNHRSSVMDPKETNPTPAPANQPGNVVDINEARDKAKLEARAAIAERNRKIRAQFAPVMNRAGVADIVNEALGDIDITVEQVSEKVLAKLGEGAGPVGTLRAGEDSGEKRLAAMQAALLARMGRGKIEGANPFRGRRLNELARASLEAAGTNLDGLSNVDICAMALGAPIRAAGGQTTSDFPVLLENTMHKLLLEGFTAQPVTWDRICAVGDVSDFREWNRLVPGLLGSLDDVNERGEFLNKNLPDAEKNKNQVKRRGNIVSITPEILVNDDIGYIQRLVTGLGGIGARTIERRTYELLESNPVLEDGKALFNAGHGNLAAAGGTTGGAPTVDLLDAARVAMSKQTAPGDDAEYLDIRPAVALCNTGLEGQMDVVLHSTYDPDAANKLQRKNKVLNLVGAIVSTPRISAAPWYLFANPNVNPVLEVVFLDGQREPRLVMEEAFRTGGLNWRVDLPFGVGAIDYRGAFKNPGA